MAFYLLAVLVWHRLLRCYVTAAPFGYIRLYSSPGSMIKRSPSFRSTQRTRFPGLIDRMDRGLHDPSAILGSAKHGTEPLEARTYHNLQGFSVLECSDINASVYSPPIPTQNWLRHSVI